jgi:glycosyltransferase involved in cell wall biosynthesis
MAQDGFEFQINQDSSTAMGGTELIYNRVMDNLSDELKEKFVIIPQRVREVHVNDKRKKILWLHDLAEDPESTHLRDEANRDLFTQFVFPSNWAMWDFHQKLGVPYEKSVVINNFIDPIEQHEKPKDGKKKIIYFSTPHRGLNILESVVRVMEQHRDDFEVDVYSSFKLYGRDEQDEMPEFKEMYDRLNELKTVNYHGTVSNEEVRTALLSSHILAYPSNYLETSCLVAIEAMAAGCLAVVPNYGALPETCKDFARMYQWHPVEQRHAATHYHCLWHALDHVFDDSTQHLLDLQTVYYNHFYSTGYNMAKWSSVLTKLAADEEANS